MKIELEVSELKELLEHKEIPPSDLYQGEPIGIHKLGDPRYNCEKIGKVEGKEWICTLPKDHTGAHAATCCIAPSGGAVVWTHCLHEAT